MVTRMARKSGLVGALLLCVVAALAQTVLPIDRQATKRTKALYKNLQRMAQKGFMFGHQDDLAYGTAWKYEKGRSDIKDITGDYPLVYGWDLGHLEIDSPVNLDSVPFALMQQLIKTGYQRGGVITISWHLNNPLTGKSAWDAAPGTVTAILPGGTHHQVYTAWLDKVASFMQGLKGKRGEYIPVIFRPFHELNGNWFWWGGSHCTPDEFTALWRFTVSYLKDIKQLHHLLYAYNTDRFSSQDAYLAKYPGNDYVDIIGFDIYQRNSPNEQFMADADTMLTHLEGMAAKHQKLPALTEFGGNNNDSLWWTNTLLPLLDRHRVAYALAWRNAGAKPNGEFEYYVPYKGHPAANDFLNLYNNDKTFFQKDVRKKKLYK